jgi:long-chain acyl-CoA synthetase
MENKRAIKNGFFDDVKNNGFPKTLNAFLDKMVEKYEERPFVGNAFKLPLTYGEFFEKVIKVAEILSEKGIKKGDKIAILGENSPNWGIAYFSIIRTGAVAVPILPDFPEADIKHIIVDAEVKILFTTEKQYEKVEDLKSSKLGTIIMLDDFTAENKDLNIESISDLINTAIDFFKKIPESIGLKSNEVKEDDIASIIYTSGTSGHSKAVMLSHKNFLSDLWAMTKLIEMGNDEVFLSILPMSHTYEFTVGFLLSIIGGARTVYIDKPPTPRVLESVCKKERPTVICSVPLILEKIYKKKVLKTIESSKVLKLVTKIPGLKKKIYGKIRDKLLEFFGGRLKLIAVGGASFNSEAETFYKSAGFPYLIGYGLTETSPLIAGGPFLEKTIKLGSTGKVVPVGDVKIDNPDKKTGIGEILYRGPNVMLGYYKNPDLTKEVLDEEGWFKTGDLGKFDKYDNLYITGRSKNMILLSNGENIYPETIEEKLNSCLFVSESLVLQRDEKIEAWIYLDYELIDEKTKGKSETQRKNFIREELEKIKIKVNEQLSSFSKISKIVEQQEPFVKTATHKIKRYLYSH